MVSVILVMAGRGTRMGIDKNKILLDLANKPVYMHSLELFLQYNFEIICVINKDDENEIVPNLDKRVKYTYGGDTRLMSVFNGLKMATGDYVIVHDAARPVISKDIIDEILLKKDNSDAILTYLPVKDTIKTNVNNKLTTLDRNILISAVTPQCAKYDILYKSLNQAINESKNFTDDISAIEFYFNKAKIELIRANDECIKLTTMLDYKLLKAIKE